MLIRAIQSTYCTHAKHSHTEQAELPRFLVEEDEGANGEEEQGQGRLEVLAVVGVAGAAGVGGGGGGRGARRSYTGLVSTVILFPSSHVCPRKQNGKSGWMIRNLLLLLLLLELLLRLEEEEELVLEAEELELELVMVLLALEELLAEVEVLLADELPAVEDRVPVPW